MRCAVRCAVRAIRLIASGFCGMFERLRSVKREFSENGNKCKKQWRLGEILAEGAGDSHLCVKKENAR